MTRAVFALLLPVALLAAACGGDDNSSAASNVDPTHPGGTVVLMTHDSFAVSKPVLRAFEAQTGTKVKILKSSGDAGVTLNQAILTKDHPIADALFGVDNTFLGRALAENVFVPYRSPALTAADSRFVLDPRHRVSPVDYGDICLNYDKQWFASAGRPRPPSSLDDLAKPAYKGLTVVEDPSQSSPGLGFLLATVEKFGSDWPRYWARLRDNGVLVDDGWEQAYNGDFTAGGGKGKRPIVVSYASSPPADVVYATTPKSAPSIAAVLTSCFRQIEFVGVLRGAKHPVQAQRLVDFMLSNRFQRDVPLEMYVYPVRRGTPLPAVFVKFGPLAPHPYVLPPQTIAKHRDDWIKTWSDVMHR